MKSADVVVIGAGVSGTSIAFRLAQQGRKVIVVERGGPGSGASGACDKAIFLQSKRPGVHMELALVSRRMYDSLGAELDADIEFQNDGGMVAIENERHHEFMLAFVEQQRRAGITVSLLDGDEARSRQPLLAPHIIGASFSPDDAEVNPLALNAALFRAAARHGAAIQTHSEVTAINHEGGRVTSVDTTKGRILTELVINAAGPYAAHIGDLAGVNVPVQPRRGTILISEPIAPVIHGSLVCSQYIAAKHLTEVDSCVPVPPFGIGLSLGQTKSGNLLIGGSREFAGFNKIPGPEVVPEIARHAARIAPAIASVRIIRSMTGFRPYTGDGLPIIDYAPGLEGYVIAAGHEGDGLALAPITGQLVSDLIAGSGPTHHFLDALRVGRLTSAAPTVVKV